MCTPNTLAAAKSMCAVRRDYSLAKIDSCKFCPFGRVCIDPILQVFSLTPDWTWKGPKKPMRGRAQKTPRLPYWQLTCF
jgi:hypothetical protein